MADILQVIYEKFGNFTASQKTIAEFMIENMNTIAFDTLEQLAAKIGVSTTTIIRFARALGLDGFTELQKEFQEHLYKKVSLPERLSASVNAEQGVDELMNESFRNDIMNIEQTLKELSAESVNNAVEMILNSKKRYVLGLRSSFSLAYYMTMRLGQILNNVHLIHTVGMSYPEEIVGISDKDVCIVYLFPRYSKITLNIISWMKTKGVKIILITDPKNNDIRSYGDIILPCKVKGISFKNTFAAPLSLSNFIVASITSQKYDECLKVIKETEDILEHGYYLGL